jgi:prepilin-type N-terminal cleavage/methylation domain-containing protein
MYRSRRNAGFTLVELMIVVGIIGVISAIAIPNFLSYQARSRRSEAYVNISGIVRAQKSYFAEKDTFHDSVFPYPDFTLRPSGVLDTTKQTWDADSQAHFDELGWKPDGAVMYSYETNSTLFCDGCELCFTASAYGDADGDGFPSAVMYVQPNQEGGVQLQCKAKLFGFGTPTRIFSNAPVYQEIEVNRQTDEF